MLLFLCVLTLSIVLVRLPLPGQERAVQMRAVPGRLAAAVGGRGEVPVHVRRRRRAGDAAGRVVRLQLSVPGRRHAGHAGRRRVVSVQVHVPELRRVDAGPVGLPVSGRRVSEVSGGRRGDVEGLSVPVSERVRPAARLLGRPVGGALRPARLLALPALQQPRRVSEEARMCRLVQVPRTVGR